jgi:UDP-glucose 4-epimerase
MILVTGAAGFIGSKIAQKLNDLGYKTITIDNLSTGYRNNIPEDTIFIEGNCGEKRTIDKLNSYPLKGIIHVAGQSSGEVSFEDPEYDLVSNTLSTLHLLNFALESNIKNFVFASTMSVYGESTGLPVSEDTLTIPKSFYACGKLASENYLRIYSELGVNTTSLRLFNVYGPGQNMKNLKQGMLSIFLAQAIEKDKITVKGSGKRFRDFVFIDDVVDSFLLSYFNENYKGYEAYNVCNGIPIYVDSMITDMLSILNKVVPIEYKDNTPGDQFGIYGTEKKMRNNLGWKPKIDFENGLKKMVNWARENL